MDVSVYDHAYAFAKPASKNDIGGLAGDAGKREQFVHFIGHNPAKIGDEFTCGANNGLCFIAKESRRTQFRFAFYWLESSEMLRAWVLGEQSRRHHVHADVGALCGEDGGYDEFPGALVVQGAGDVGIEPVQALQHVIDSSGGEWVVALQRGW